jgi:hypothetical protein
MNDNIILAAEVNYTKSEMSRTGATMLRNLAILLYDKALVHVAELTEYGITSEKLAAFKDDIDQFSNVLPQIRMGITEKKQATSHLAQLIDDNDKLLDKMDSLIEIIKLDYPDFYEAYRSNRKVLVNRTGTIVLTGRISDAITREGIYGVKVTFSPQNGLMGVNASKAEAPMVKVTAKKGRFRVKSMKPGTYNAVLRRRGYKEKIVNVLISPGEMTVLNEELESM